MLIGLYFLILYWQEIVFQIYRINQEEQRLLEYIRISRSLFRHYADV